MPGIAMSEEAGVSCNTAGSAPVNPFAIFGTSVSKNACRAFYKESSCPTAIGT